MPAKILAVAAQVGLAILAWYIAQNGDERRQLQARGWKELESLAMQCAKEASNFAAYAEQKYKQAVSVG